MCANVSELVSVYRARHCCVSTTEMKEKLQVSAGTTAAQGLQHHFVVVLCLLRERLLILVVT
jgi:hypothetical protein